jgi:hypothetical protein
MELPLLSVLSVITHLFRQLLGLLLAKKISTIATKPLFLKLSKIASEVNKVNLVF